MPISFYGAGYARFLFLLVFRAGLLGDLPPPTLRFNASMRSMTLDGFSEGPDRSIVLPPALRFTSFRSANSYSSLNLAGSNFPDLLSRI